MIKILLLFITLFFSFNLSVDAALCDKEHIVRLKELAEQVEVDYEYIINEDNDNNGDDEITVNTYMITVNLLSNELYFIYDNNNYYYTESNNGLISFIVNSGDLRLSIHSRRCTGYKLSTININLPRFNVYSYRTECKINENLDLDVCDPWYQGILTDEKFNEVVNKFLNSNIVIEDKNIHKVELFFKKYYLYIIGFVVIFIGFIIFAIYNRKRSVLE